MTDYPEILQELAEVARTLAEREGLPADRAAAFARELTEHVRHTFGGQQIYIPKGRAYDLSQRDQEIARRFTGHNRDTLCREYGITLQRLYQIVNAVRGREAGRAQRDLCLSRDF